MSDKEIESSDDLESTNKIVVKKAVDLQRLKLEKLMKNPEKPAFIPNFQKEKKFPDAPEFVRNVMGSSAGAGSGEFHVYRHIRRREYARNVYLQMAKEKQTLDEEYRQKIKENKELEKQKADKKREKRKRYKTKIKMLQKIKKLKTSTYTDNSENKSSGDDDGEVKEKEASDKETDR